MRDETSPFERQFQIVMIRTAADRMAGVQVTDFQIVFCAEMASIISVTAFTLEELSDFDLGNLYLWMLRQ